MDGDQEMDEKRMPENDISGGRRRRSRKGRKSRKSRKGRKSRRTRRRVRYSFRKKTRGGVGPGEKKDDDKYYNGDGDVDVDNIPPNVPPTEEEYPTEEVYNNPPTVPPTEEVYNNPPTVPPTEEGYNNQPTEDTEEVYNNPSSGGRRKRSRSKWSRR